MYMYLTGDRITTYKILNILSFLKILKEANHKESRYDEANIKLI